MKKIRIIPIILITVLILFLSFPLINLNNQLKQVNYPGDYQELNSFLNTIKISGKIIYLPWQTYLTYSWTINSSSDGRIPIPINQILKYPVLTGPDIYGSGSFQTQIISNCLSNNSIECLKQNQIQLLIYDKCSLYKEQSIIENLSSKIYSNACIDLYEINSNAVQTQQPIPARFLISSIISLITITGLITYLIKFKRPFTRKYPPANPTGII
jgi:hypothetical protein